MCQSDNPIHKLRAYRTHSLASGWSDAAADIVQRYAAVAEQTDHDNWNGGTGYRHPQFKMPASDYARLGAKRSQMEQ